MKVGDYVRTRDGLITKFEREDGIFYVFDKMITTDKDINRYVNISPSIIDLIEVGDYVNGDKVLFITKNGNTRLEVVCSDGEKLLGWRSYKEKEFKSIVTKEQFERMEYKI